MGSRLVRHGVLTAPADATPEQVREQAEQQARAGTPNGWDVAFVHIHGSESAPGGTMLWRYSFQLIDLADGV